ncbi:MAG: hypothetical protein CK425_12880 [Parachlamydia sp.]|nr:MAG: hypothetical protein CK425_12880 [Parachlamydia sp.]
MSKPRLDFDKPSFDSVLANAALAQNVVIASNLSVRAPYGPMKNRLFSVLNVLLRAVTFGQKGVATTFPEKSMKAVAAKIKNHPTLFLKPDNVVNIHTVLERYIQQTKNPKIKQRLEKILQDCHLNVKDAEKTLAQDGLKDLAGLMAQISNPGAAATIAKSVERILEHCSKEDLSKDKDLTYSNLTQLVGRFGNPEMVKTLLAKSDDVDLRKAQILDGCIEGDNVKVFEALFEDAKEANLKGDFLMKASTKPFITDASKVLAFVINQNELRFTTSNGVSTNLVIKLLSNSKADEQRLMGIVMSMLDKDPTLINEAESFNLHTPLIHAVISGLAKITAELLTRGADSKAKNKKAMNAVKIAIGLKGIAVNKEARNEAALLVLKAGDKDMWVDAGLVAIADKDAATVESVIAEFNKQIAS